MRKAKWIRPKKEYGAVCPVYKFKFATAKEIKSATLEITAMGVYEAFINGSRVGDFIMAPGWTAYDKRHQYQNYDITEILKKDNEICVSVGKGWYRGRLVTAGLENIWGSVPAIIAAISVVYTDGEEVTFTTNQQWKVAPGKILFSEIYDGEVYDASYNIETWEDVTYFRATTCTLIPQQGEIVCEHEHIKPIDSFVTPKGERVIDFGQNLTGYVSFSVNGKLGDRIAYSHAEVLDADGNFYTENLRSAKQKVEYICCEGKQEYKPHHTFMGFRYIRLDEAPEYITPDMFEAIVVHSDIRRTGYFECSDKKINKLYQNIIWGQKGNFLDVPTDCPQRDERLGWTGDAQVFVKTASYNYDVKKFFGKWLQDLSAEQRPDGAVPQIVPDVLPDFATSSGWGDAVTICPWQLYLFYGDKAFLEKHIDNMIAWVEYMHSAGEEEYLWIGDFQQGDWLGMDGGEGSFMGASDHDFIASAHFAYSTLLLVKALKVLGRDASYYEKLHKNIVSTFQKRFSQCNTQTECALALAFDLANDKAKTAAKLADMVRENGNKLTTGFIGTPYIMDALSRNGYTEVAYSLLLQEENPSWLFSVNMGATTIWEHWDSINSDGAMWSSRMNSFNHYAYGCVGTWMYETMCGIAVDEKKPGFEKIVIRPQPDRRIRWAKASLECSYGTIKSGWEYKDDFIEYTLVLPALAHVEIGDKKFELDAGNYIYRYFIETKEIENGEEEWIKK
ncbi:MAG: family 78 glycoside hydrolase catalytic domain [Clostridia bacterium]|nr:family 78 glycoside hydrolase catalytic domain [Clostridia bacterium]